MKEKGDILLEKFNETLSQCPVIAILRGILPADALRICEILIESGIKLIEVPLNSPDVLESIKIASEGVGSKCLIGAGTVLTKDDVSDVAAAGGKFIISPNTNLKVIKKTKKLGLVSMPGFLTPTEAFSAMDEGADFLKCFPAGSMGVNYLKDLKAVIKKPIVSVGGIGISNINDFLSVSVAVGIGSSLFKPGKSDDAIRKDAIQLMDEIRKGKRD
jgi:2-dehydro-3-deoxyphosphogalactonate aldolase